MRNVAAPAIALAILATTLVAALPSAVLQVDRSVLEGYQEWHGELNGAALSFSQRMPEASFEGEGASIRVRTTNFTATTVMGVGADPQRGGSDLVYPRATVRADAPGDAVAVMVLPISGAPLPTLGSATGQLTVGASATEEVREVAYVDSSRQTLGGVVSDALQLDARGTSVLRIEGSFALSLWAWNFTAESPERSGTYVTGSHRENPVADPITGTDVSWTAREEVAQVFITDGWIEFRDGFGSAWSVFVPSLEITGSGNLRFEGVTGQIGEGGPIDSANVAAAGNYGLTQERSQDSTSVMLGSLVGHLAVNDQPLDLGKSGPIRNDSTQVAVGGPAWAQYLGPFAAVIGIMVVAVLVKGPAQTVRFNRVQSRFDSHDYLGVLTRIEPFTRKRRYERKATFLKTVSLLSLQEYREAALYLETMGPREAPEPATKAFLQATAAAGLGQDDVAIQHLTTCLRLDPSYKEEVKTVPVLAGYLAYFELNPRGAAQ